MNVNKVKQHFKDNGKIYLIGASCAILGAVATIVVSYSKAEASVDVVNQGIFYKSPVTNNIITVLERRGHPGNVIRCIETGEVFASQGRTASLLDIDPSALSKHLRGKSPHVNGLTFENLGEAS